MVENGRRGARESVTAWAQEESTPAAGKEEQFELVESRSESDERWEPKKKAFALLIDNRV